MLLAGCQATRMPGPDELSTSQRLAVEGRQGWKIHEHLRFGPYEAHEIDRSWTRGRDREILLYSGNKRRQRYTFTLREGGVDRWDVSCEANLTKHALGADGAEVALKNRSWLDCSLRSLGAPAEVWEMALSERSERPLGGRLSHGAAELEVRGTRKIQGGLPGEATTGYEVLEEERVVGAVEVVNNGAVWLHEGLSPDRQSLLSASAAALLLLEDLRESLPDALSAR